MKQIEDFFRTYVTNELQILQTSKKCFKFLNDDFLFCKMQLKKGYNLLFIFRQSSLNNKQHAALIHFSFLSPSFILIEAPKIALVLLAPRVVQEKTGHS